MKKKGRTMKKKSFTPYIIALVLFVSAIGFMTYSGLNSGAVYFLNVSEALASTDASLEKSMRLFGTVGSYEKNSSGDSVVFTLVDAEKPDFTMTVTYSGVIPDTFEHEAEVILEGNMASGTEFHAKTLMTKCPSKYEKENRT